MSKYLFTLFTLLSLAFISPKLALAATPSRGFMDTTFYALGGAVSGISSDSEIGRAACGPMAQEKFIMGCSPSADGKYAISGITPKLGDYVAIALTTPPLNVGEYVADLGSSIGLPGFKVEAQGIGYKALTPVLGMWKAFRNLAYSLYIIVFLVIGVMIMFRTKVNAQTIITIQSSLPNLLITLLLITFSYAIAGFVIDLIYLSMYLLIYTAAASGLIHAPQEVVSNILNQNIFQIMIFGQQSIVLIGAGAVQSFVSTVAGGQNTLTGGGAGLLGYGLGFLFIGLGVLVGMFKTLWQLIQSYFMIIASTVMAPLQLLLNGVPGSKAFSNWLRNLVANAAVFPVVLAMLMFGAIIMGPGAAKFSTEGKNAFNVNDGVGYLQADGTSSNWVPPMLGFIDPGNKDVGSPGASLQETFMALLGVFIILMVPSAAQMTRDALKVEQNKYTSEIGTALQTGYGMTSPLRSWGSGLWRQREANIQMQRSATLQANALADKIGPRK